MRDNSTYQRMTESLPLLHRRHQHRLDRDASSNIVIGRYIEDVVLVVYGFGLGN
jgi:hypothetical protein